MEHRGHSTSDGLVRVGGGDLDVAVAGVLAAPGGHDGVGQDVRPGDEFGGVVDGGGDVTDDVELSTDTQQDRELACLVCWVHDQDLTSVA